MINFRNIRFVRSAVDREEELDDKPNVVFVGRSNVGKSTLINLIADNKGLAFVSRRPGMTRLLNYFDVDGKFYLVDAPGYGYRSLGKKDAFDDMMDAYFTGNPSLKLVVWLLDPRRELSEEDRAFYRFLKERGLPAIVVFTKADKLNQSEKAKVKKTAGESLSEFEYLLTSSSDKRNVEALRNRIAASLFPNV